MAKYDALFEHLCRAGDGPLELTFDEVGGLVGGLPATAERLRAWWSNDPGGRNGHARAWLDAGREVVGVDLAARRVSFSAAGWRRGS